MGDNRNINRHALLVSVFVFQVSLNFSPLPPDKNLINDRHPYIYIYMLYIIMTACAWRQLKNATRKHPYFPMGADLPRFDRFSGPPADPAWHQTACHTAVEPSPGEGSLAPMGISIPMRRASWYHDVRGISLSMYIEKIYTCFLREA
jgi:hypothetical protein